MSKTETFAQQIKREFESSGRKKVTLSMAEREKAMENGILVGIIRQLGRNISDEEYHEISKLL